MVDGSFRESYHSIDFFCRQDWPIEDYELIWVEYYDKANPQLIEKINSYPNARLITLGRTGIYHSSYCFNAGIAESAGELIVIPDADLVAESNALETIWREHESNHKLVMYLLRYEEPQDRHETEIGLPHLREVCAMTSHSNFGACLTVRKKWLLDINGYEQHPVFESGFHANGQDVNTRLKNLGLHVMWHPGIKLYHPWHPFTKVAADAYRLQERVIHYRALNLITRAFQGLNPALNIDFPVALAAEITECRKQLEQAANRPSWKRWGRRIVSELRSLYQSRRIPTS